MIFLGLITSTTWQLYHETTFVYLGTLKQKYVQRIKCDIKKFLKSQEEFRSIETISPTELDIR